MTQVHARDLMSCLCVCSQDALLYLTQEVGAAEGLWAEAKTIVGGNSGVKALQASKQLLSIARDAWTTLPPAAPATLLPNAAPAPDANSADALAKAMSTAMAPMLSSLSTSLTGALQQHMPAKVEAAPYAAPAGTMNVNVTDQVNTLASKMALEKEVDLLKTMGQERRDEVKAAFERQDASSAALARIAESKAGADPMDQMAKFLTLMQGFQQVQQPALTMQAQAPAPALLPPPAAAPSEAGLPHGWQAINSDRGVPYYYNSVTGKTQYARQLPTHPAALSL